MLYLCQNLNTRNFFDKLTIIITLDYIRLYKKRASISQE